MEIIIKTPRRTFNAIEFKNDTEAREKGFTYYFNNDDGKEIYIKHRDNYHCIFGFIMP